MNVVFEWAVSSVLGSPNAQAGAIDVIAIRKQDESLSCSPFHVKLGKSSKKGEKGIVKVKVNKQDVELSMKLGPAGEAFFVERSRDFRRDPSGSFPTSPRDAQDNQPFLSPRNAEDNISVPLNVAESLDAGYVYLFTFINILDLIAVFMFSCAMLVMLFQLKTIPSLPPPRLILFPKRIWRFKFQHRARHSSPSSAPPVVTQSSLGREASQRARWFYPKVRRFLL